MFYKSIQTIINKEILKEPAPIVVQTISKSFLKIPNKNPGSQQNSEKQSKPGKKKQLKVFLHNQ